MNKHEVAILSQIIMKPDLFFQTSLHENYFTTADTRKTFLAIKRCITILKIEPTPVNLLDQDSLLSGQTLGQIAGAFTGEMNYKYHQEIIIEAYKKKVLEQMLVTCLSNVKESKPENTIQKIETTITEIYKSVMNSDIQKLGDSVLEYSKVVEERYHSKTRMVGLPSGWGEVDNYLLGFQPELFYVLGARPSQGKTAAGLNILSYLALKKNIPVGLLSLESGTSELLGRITAAEAGVPLHRLKLGSVKEHEFDYITGAFGKISDAPLYVIDSPAMTLAQVCGFARRMVVTKGIKLLAIDYLSIIDSELKTTFKRDQVSLISQSLKQLARELKIPIIALAQLNRDAHGHKPTLAHLAESGQIERDADAVIFIWHNPKDDKSYFLIEKNRDGATGAVQVFFDKPKMRFKESYHE